MDKHTFYLIKHELILWIKLFLLILYFVDNFMIYFIHKLADKLIHTGF